MKYEALVLAALSYLVVSTLEVDDSPLVGLLKTTLAALLLIASVTVLFI